MVRPNVASLMHTAVMFANDVESPPWGTSSSLRWRRCRCWWYLPWTHLRGDAKVVIIAQVQRRHGDRTVHPLTWSGVSGGSVSLLNIQPCCFFFLILNLVIIYSDLCHLQQFRCPQVPLKMRALISPSIHLFFPLLSSCFRLLSSLVPAWYGFNLNLSLRPESQRGTQTALKQQ